MGLFQWLSVFLLCAASFDLGSCARVRHLEYMAENSDSEPVVMSRRDDIIYEEGFIVETVLDENKINSSIYSTLPVPGGDYIYALDMTASQVLKIKIPVDPGTVIGQIAGSYDGEAGHRDGLGKDSLFNHPRDFTVDDVGNIYVADVRARVIRKIDTDGMVSTIVGESNVTGNSDGEGKNAHFSSDFSVTYIPSMCSLIVADRGNRRLRQIRLKKQAVCHPGHTASGFAVDLQGLLLVVASTVVMTVIGVLTFKHVKLSERLAGLHVMNRLMLRNTSPLRTPLQQSHRGHPCLMGNGTSPVLQTSSVPAEFFHPRQPDLIDFNSNSSEEGRLFNSANRPNHAADRPHHAAFILDGNNSCIGPGDEAAYAITGSGLAYTQSAPGSLDFNREDEEENEIRKLLETTR